MAELIGTNLFIIIFSMVSYIPKKSCILERNITDSEMLITEKSDFSRSLRVTFIYSEQAGLTVVE